MGQSPPGFIFSGYQGVFHWGEKQPWHEVQHPFAPHAQVKSEWSYTPSPPIRLHVADRDNFTFIAEPCHVTVLINNALFHTPTLSPNSSAFHTSPPPTTSLSQTSLPAHHCTTIATGYLSQSSLPLFWCSNVSRTAWPWRWQSTWHNTPEDFSLLQHSCQNLTSRSATPCHK